MIYNAKERISYYFDIFILFIEFSIFIGILFELGHTFRPIVYDLGKLIIGALIIDLIVQIVFSPYLILYIRRFWYQYLIVGLLFYTYYRFAILPKNHELFFLYSRLFLLLVEVLIFSKFVLRVERLREIISALRVNPAQLIIVSFASIILTGSFLLYLPISHAEGTRIRYIDVLFTATSAVCVTGLVVVPTGSAFSRIGKIFVLLLIQAGGLGIMTIAAFVQVVIRSEMSLYGRFQTASLLDQSNMKNLYSLVRSIVRLTFSLEAIGLILFLPYTLGQTENIGDAFFQSIFHAVSAFCNAGFSLYPDNLMGARSNILVNLDIIFLIVMGGMGFTVLMNLGRRIIRGVKERILLQSRIVIVTTIFLILFGAISFYLFERENILKDSTPLEKVLVPLFQSVTTRTAGFNTVDTGSLKTVTQFMLSTLMFIGASPGGTGGGIKTTTLFILILSIITILRDQRFNIIFKRRVPFEVVNRAFAILVLSIGLIITGTLLLGLSENFSATQIWFEVVSAFGTVGLSTGITPQLSDFGKVVIILTMFIGRLGPLTMVLAVRNRQRTRAITYPEERVMVG